MVLGSRTISFFGGRGAKFRKYLFVFLEKWASRKGQTLNNCPQQCLKCCFFCSRIWTPSSLNNTYRQNLGSRSQHTVPAVQPSAFLGLLLLLQLLAAVLHACPFSDEAHESITHVSKTSKRSLKQHNRGRSHAARGGLTLSAHHCCGICEAHTEYTPIFQLPSPHTLT